MCNEHGECKCGKCECTDDYVGTIGDFCNCLKSECPKWPNKDDGKICGGKKSYSVH